MKKYWDFLALFSIFHFAVAASAGETPRLPAPAATPSLPSLQAFGSPRPPSALESVKDYMPDIEFWKGKTKDSSSSANSFYAAALTWPVQGKVSSGYGPRGATTHEGIDIPVPTGTPVQAAAAGVVVEARTYRGYGGTVIIAHPNGTRTLYAHCSSLAVKQDQHVESGQVIAFAGSTGRSTNSHVHFGVMINGAFQDPLLYLKEGPLQFVKNP